MDDAQHYVLKAEKACPKSHANAGLYFCKGLMAYYLNNHFEALQVSHCLELACFVCMLSLKLSPQIVSRKSTWVSCVLQACHVGLVKIHFHLLVLLPFAADP